MLELVYNEDQIDKDLPITASEKYLKAITNYSYGWFLSADFVLPFIIEKRAIFKRIVFTHETIYLNENLSLVEEKKFLDDVVRYAEKTDADFIYQPRPGVVFSICPNNCRCAPFGSYQIDLTLDEDVLFANLHSKHRNVIRKAIKDGVIIKFGREYLDICANLMQQTMSRQGLPYLSKREMLLMQKEMGQNLIFYVAFKDGIPQGAAMLVYKANFACYYLHGGSITSPSPGSMNLLHWNAMLDMKSLGVRIYDFVGARVTPNIDSKLESIQKFKSRFGAQLKKGYLWKVPINRFMYGLFYLFAKINAIVHGVKYKGDIIDEENNKGYFNI